MKTFETGGHDSLEEGGVENVAEYIFWFVCTATFLRHEQLHCPFQRSSQGAVEMGSARFVVVFFLYTYSLEVLAEVLESLGWCKAPAWDPVGKQTVLQHHHLWPPQNPLQMCLFKEIFTFTFTHIQCQCSPGRQNLHVLLHKSFLSSLQCTTSFCHYSYRFASSQNRKQMIVVKTMYMQLKSSWLI